MLVVFAEFAIFAGMFGGRVPWNGAFGCCWYGRACAELYAALVEGWDRRGWKLVGGPDSDCDIGPDTIADGPDRAIAIGRGACDVAKESDPEEANMADPELAIVVVDRGCPIVRACGGACGEPNEPCGAPGDGLREYA